jgi:hypothetical protein
MSPLRDQSDMLFITIMVQTIQTDCVWNVVCLNVKPDGTNSIHYAIRDWPEQIAIYCFILHHIFLYKAMAILNMGIRHDNKTNKCT